MKKIILLASICVTSSFSFAISPSLLAQQSAAMTYGVNSNARVVGTTTYVPTTTRFDNKSPSYSSSYQNTVSDLLSRGKSMDYAQSMAKNGPSYTSLNAANLNSANSSTTTSSKYVASSTATSAASTSNGGLICGYSGATPMCAKSLSQLPANFRR